MSQVGGEIHVTVRALQALTSGGRMNVLRSLRARRMTAAEVATATKMRKSSAHKHLTRLAIAGFVRRHEDDRVCVYYSLTTHGRHLVESERPRLVLILGGTVVLLCGLAVAVAWQVWAWWRLANEAWNIDHIGPPPPLPTFWTPALTLSALATCVLGVALVIVVKRVRVRNPARDP